MTILSASMTKLEAVNNCLSAIGQPSVNSLEGAGLDAQIASDTLDTVTKQVQARGFHWNTECFTLSPNVDGVITLPLNCGRIDSVGNDVSLNVINRGGKLYNKDTHSNNFTKPVTVEIILILSFEDLPLSAQIYITIRAARTFQERVLGASEVEKYTENNEKEALILLMQEETETLDANMIYSSPSSAAIMQRIGYARGVN